MDELSPNVIAALAGFPIGVAFGAVVQRTNFCTMGAISDIVLFGDWRRMRAWLLAIAVAMAASQSLDGAGLIDLSSSIYLSPRLLWAGAILGGLCFGIGMVFASGCGSRNLVRLGCGDLRALFVILVLGFSAITTLHGLTALLRVGLDDATAVDLANIGLETQGLPALMAVGIGQETRGWGWLLGITLALAVAVFCFAGIRFRHSPRDVTAGIILGLLVAAGWWATGLLAFDEFEPQPLVSLTFVAPVGNSLLYLMTFTGSSISFGVAVVAGVIVGAYCVAVLCGEFRLQGFADSADLIRSLVGALLMGFGGVTALGCTIGQGITGLSTLSLGSFIAFASLVAGGVIGVHLLGRWSG